jgi:hypothetical protein
MEPHPDTPVTSVSVFLFGKPAWEIEGLEGFPVDMELLDGIAAHGISLCKRLARAAEVGRRLVQSGWEGYGLLYDIEFYKTVALREAEDELKRLGIEPDEVSIREESEDRED